MTGQCDTGDERERESSLSALIADCFGGAALELVLLGLVCGGLFAVWWRVEKGGAVCIGAGESSFRVMAKIDFCLRWWLFTTTS